VLFTFAPRTRLLATMHAVGRLFPRGDRAPAIIPVSERGIARLITGDVELMDWRLGRTRRISTGFYISQALELAAR
jgi:magnesium-protoporphyrin O-methyltransferase